VENCVTWVFAALVTVLGQAWADFDVYMPDTWAKDPRRRRRAGIPDALKFATKPDLAIEQVKRLAKAGLRFLWAAAGEVCGRSGRFRGACRALSLAYVVIIPCDYRVATAAGTVIRADQAVSDAVFERRSCGNGTKGPRYSDWALIATADPREFLLIRRRYRQAHCLWPEQFQSPCRLCPYPQVCRWTTRRVQNVPFWFTPSTPSSWQKHRNAACQVGRVLGHLLVLCLAFKHVAVLDQADERCRSIPMASRPEPQAALRPRIGSRGSTCPLML